MCIMPDMKDWKWIDLPETGSTNDEARKYSAVAGGGKFVITAVRQNKGRGRRGRSWVGMEGNLFMSLGIEVPLAWPGQLIFIVTLALAQSILKLSPAEDVRIKWPNDVLVRGCKISGILLEKGEGGYVIAGIGVNIAAAPDLPGQSYSAVSLREAGILTERVEFLKLYLSCFDELWDKWRNEGFLPLREMWLSLAAGLRTEIKIVQEQTEKRGIFSGVDENGLLLLERNGKIEKISAGDVFFEKGNN